VKLKLGNAAILAYQRLPYKPWYAIAEFVDNSTDAYFRGGNKERLDAEFAKTGDRLTVEVTYDRNEGGLLRIHDNSMGMSEGELEDALVIGEPPKVSAGRSEFGMGMKTAAIWFADEFEIRTKKLGEENEIRTTVNVQNFVSGDDELVINRTPKAVDAHYTLIELRGLKRRLGPSSLTKASRFLSSIYRMDLRDGTLDLMINGDHVTAPTSRDDDAFLTRSDGSKLVVDIDEDVYGKKVTGWMGVLAPGYSGRSNAGFALVRHNRTLRGWLDSWRPEEIFGDARNDLLNQRVAGELFVDAFSASHTKDAVDWDDDEEEVLGKLLKERAAEYGLLREAKRKVTQGRESHEGELETAEARSKLATQLNAPKVHDTIVLLDVPKPELAQLSTEVLLEASESSEPVVTWGIGPNRVARLYELDLSPNDPYFEYEVMDGGDLRVVINANHPAAELLSSAEAKLAHYHHVTLDAIAEWKCSQQHEPLNPSSIRLMKDHLFRAISEIEETL
jgi:hypothetical protein